MLEFKDYFSVNEQIEQFLHEKRHDESKPDDWRPCVQIVGQEQSGCLLYTWSDIGPDGEKEVTYVGLYDPFQKTNKIIFVHDKLVKIVNATVAQELTFLGFVTVDYELATESYDKKHKLPIYRAFLVEIKPQNRVFFLNLERIHYIHLQFLYGQYKGHYSARESHLLVLLHKESVGLYHISIARFGDEGILMNVEPRKEQIFHKPFAWYQWDCMMQRLHIVHFRKQGKDQSGHSLYKPFLNSYQFNANTVNQFVLEVMLELPIPHMRSSASETCDERPPGKRPPRMGDEFPRSTYLDPGPWNCFPDANMNIEILTQANGTVCVCYQHPVPAKSPPLPQPPPAAASGKKKKLRQTPSAEEPPVNIQYSVSMIHHDKILHCTGPAIPRNWAESARIHFSWLDQYILVHLPGVFTHLLNVSVEFEPCHHITWHDPCVSNSSVRLRDIPDPTQHLIPLVRDKNTLSSGLCVFCCQDNKAYRVQLKREELEDMFQRSSSSFLRQAIIHHAIVHIKDLFACKRLFEIMMADPMRLDVSSVLAEFLVASTYTSLRRKIDRSLMKYFAFTNADTFRGQVEKTSSGTHLCTMRYSPLGNVTLGKTGKESALADDTWENLAMHRSITSKPTRFLAASVAKEIERLGEDDDFDKTWELVDSTEEKREEEKASQPQGLFRKIRSAFSSSKSTGSRPSTPQGDQSASRPSSRSELVLGSPAPFLNKTPDKAEVNQARLITKTVEMLVNHLKHYLPRDPLNKLQSIALEFTGCQLSQSRQMCQLIWTVMVPEDLLRNPSLATPGTEPEQDVLSMFERYVFTLLQTGYPLPAGFQLYFSKLAFRCLKLRMFLQYIDHGVLSVTPEFALQLISELEDSPENVEAKFYILSKIPKNDILTCLRTWDHPLSRRIVARDYTAACLSDDLTKSWPAKEKYSKSDSNVLPKVSSMDNGAPFPPLASLVKLIENQDTMLTSGERGITSDFLMEASLVDLMHEQYQNEYHHTPPSSPTFY